MGRTFLLLRYSEFPQTRADHQKNGTGFAHLIPSLTLYCLPQSITSRLQAQQLVPVLGYPFKNKRGKSDVGKSGSLCE